MTAFLFTFEDQDTGELIDRIAPNEATARLQVSNGNDIERMVLWSQPAEISRMQKIIDEAIRDERTAHDAANAANPMGKNLVTTPEQLKAFRAAEASSAVTTA